MTACNINSFRHDPFARMRFPDHAHVVRPWLAAETEYARITLESAPGAKAFFSRVSAEITSRETAGPAETVASAPDVRDGFAYYTVTSADGWPTWCRRRVGEKEADGPEHILVDHKRLSVELGGYADVTQLKVSGDASRAAYSVDSTGAERYTLHVIDLPSENAPSGSRARRIDEVGVMSLFFPLPFCFLSTKISASLVRIAGTLFCSLASHSCNSFVTITLHCSSSLLLPTTTTTQPPQQQRFTTCGASSGPPTAIVFCTRVKTASFARQSFGFTRSLLATLLASSTVLLAETVAARKQTNVKIVLQLQKERASVVAVVAVAVVRTACCTGRLTTASSSMLERPRMACSSPSTVTPR